MGKKLTLICDETPSLKLGPGTGPGQTPGELIVFAYGFADVDRDDYPNLDAWLSAPGTPHIEVIAAGSDRVPTGTGFVCPTCGKSFSTQKALNGHRLSHRT
jgi:hypothetical protein